MSNRTFGNRAFGNSGSFFALNQKYSQLLQILLGITGGSTPVPTSSNLADVLINGNSAGSNDIDMNNQDILQVNNIDLVTINGSAYPPVVSADDLSAVLTAGNTATNSIILNNTGTGTNVISLLPNFSATDPHITLTDGTTTNTINKNGYTTRNSVQNLTHYINFSDSSATGTGSIQKTAGLSCNPSTNTLSATTFIGALSGTATTATNIAGGAGGSIPYQSSANTTALLANGTAGQVLTSAGTTLAPTWATPASTSQTLAQVLTTGNSAGSTSINMNSQDITAVNNISVASPYNFSIISIYANSTARDTALPSPYQGQFCFLTGTNVLQYYNSGWFSITASPVLPTISGFTLASNYEIIYVNAGNSVVPAPVNGGFTIVRFYPTTTTSGTITLSQSTAITYLVVAGGGGGGGAITSLSNGGGGGAGGYLSTTANMTASTSYAVSVGGGGAGGSAVAGTAGTNSSLVVASGTITANGGGGGGITNGGNGGSGGGAGAVNVNYAGGTGSQGNNGGNYTIITADYCSGGGGGASTAGTNGGGATPATGGNGTANTITGASVVYAGGGGGGSNTSSASPASGGTGGGGNGGAGVPASTYTPATAGTDGRGGGGGGGGQGASANVGFKGGAGVVIVRFPSFI